MKKTMLIALLALLSLSAMAHTRITAEKNNADADLCYYKAVQIQGYAQAKLIGRCNVEQAMNGMKLFLVAVPEDPNQDAQRIMLADTQNVESVKQVSGQLHITIASDSVDSNDRIILKRNVLLVQSVNVENGIFLIH